MQLPLSIIIFIDYLPYIGIHLMLILAIFLAENLYRMKKMTEDESSKLKSEFDLLGKKLAFWQTLSKKRRGHDESKESD